jgi:hypothetical protein
VALRRARGQRIEAIFGIMRDRNHCERGGRMITADGGMLCA